jgi:protein SCO1/2
MIVLLATVLWRWGPAIYDGAASWLGPQAAIGGPFSLVDSTGKRISDQDLLGKPFAVFFGYTHCPDVCPTTLQDMSGWLQSLGPDAVKLRILFVTVDPERDTPQALKSYMSAFDSRIIGLTGTSAEVANMLAAYRVYAKKVDVKGGDYAMDHSAVVYLMGADGRFKTIIGYQEQPTAAARKLEDLVHGG